LIGADRFLQVFNRIFLTAETVALLMMQPTKLLEDLGMVWIPIEDSSVCQFGIVIIFLLLMHMADLKPNIFFCQRNGWNRHDVAKALETLLVFLLLLVNYAQAKINFVGLFKIRLHAHDL
jgi:hypothetical protein